MASTSASLSLLGGAGRGFASVSCGRACSGGSGWLGPADGPTGGLGAEQRLELAKHSSITAAASSRCPLSASSRSKSSDAFPWISRACLCLASWSSRRSLRLRNRSSSRSRLRSASCGAWAPAGEMLRHPGPAPLDDMARVEALPPQQRTLGARVGRGRYSSRIAALVLGGEPASAGFGRWVVVTHPILGARPPRMHWSWSSFYGSCPRPGGMVGSSRCLTSA